MFFLGRKPAVFNKKRLFTKKSKKNEKECWHSCKALIEYILRWWSAASSKDEPNDPERYRSGHNEAVLKTVCPKGRVGSNPTLSVGALLLRWKQNKSWWFNLIWRSTQEVEGTPLERVQVVNSGARVQIPPSPSGNFPGLFLRKLPNRTLTNKQQCNPENS